jgi:hypothetical protein
VERVITIGWNVGGFKWCVTDADEVGLRIGEAVRLKLGSIDSGCYSAPRTGSLCDAVVTAR